MSQIRPKIQLRYSRQNEPIRVPISDLLVDPQGQTFVTENSAAGNTTLNVKNTTSFANAIAVLIGQPGQQGSEIVLLNYASGLNTLALTSATQFPHSVSTPVYSLNFDQIEISHSDSLGGSKATLVTLDIVADQETTNYNDLVSTDGYYWARFYDSQNDVFSPFSDPVPYGNYAVNTARYIIDGALNEINKFDKASDVLTDEYFFQQLNNLQNEVKNELKRWSWLQLFDQNIATANVGDWAFDVPANLDDQNTNKSIYNIRIGTNLNLTWVDKEKWNNLLQSVAYTTLAEDLAVNATSMVLTDSGNFTQSPTITINGNNYASNPTSLYTVAVAAGGTGYSVGDVLTVAGGTGGTVQVAAVNGGVVTYLNILTIGTGYSAITETTTGGGGTGCTVAIEALTANNLATNTITIEPAGAPATTGDNVFFNASTGNPQIWTTFGGKIYIYPIISQEYNGNEVLMDYYSKLTPIFSDADVVAVPDIVCVSYYLQWKALKKLNNGEDNAASTGAMKQYLNRLNTLKNKEVMGRTFIVRPRINNWAKLTRFGVDNTPRNIRDGNFPNTDF